MFVPGDRILESQSEVESVAFSKNGALLAAGCRDGKIRVWNLASGALERTVEAKGANLLAAHGHFSTVGADGSIAIRSWESDQTVRQVPAPRPRAFAVVSSPDGKLIAGAGRAADTGSENLVRVWDSTGKERFQSLAGVGGISRMVFSPNGEFLIAGSYDADLRVWDTRNGELKRKVEELTVSMFDMTFSPDGKHLATAGVDRIVYLWETANWRLVRKLTGQPEMIAALAFSPDGRQLATGGFDEMAFKNPAHVMIWDLASGKTLRTVNSTQRVARLSYSPDGKLVAVADRGKKVNLWAVSV